MKRFWQICSLLTLSVVSLSLLSEKGSSSSSGTTFSGQATVVRATVLGINTTLSDTGPLPPEGGAREASLLEANVPGLLTAEVLHASTVGQDDASRSEASVANLTLTVGGNTITADFLMSRATAFCQQGRAFVSGSSEIVNLVINGQSITVTGQPNQTAPLPVGYVVINEQQGSASGKDGEITVNALHVVIPGFVDVVISSAYADIHCGGQPPCDRDFVTGGGFITPSGTKANFAVAGGTKTGFGHLHYIDHGTGMKVKGTSVTAYVITGATTRHIEGTCEINGQGGFTYQVDVDDQGEPGRNDTFAIQLSNGYSAGDMLGGGNIQLHTCK